jgi:hypothetical protein
MEWIHVAQDGEQWQALVSTAMKIPPALNVGKSLCGFSRTKQFYGTY